MFFPMRCFITEVKIYVTLQIFNRVLNRIRTSITFELLLIYEIKFFENKTKLLCNYEHKGNMSKTR